MSVTLQTQYGNIVLAKLRQKSITQYLFNNNYQRNAATGTLMIPMTSEDTLADYDKANISNNSVSYDTNAWIPCVIDKDKFLNKYLDGYEVASLPYSTLQDNLERLGYATAKAMDEHAIQTLIYAAQGLDKYGVAFTSSDPRYDANSSYGIIESLGSDDIYDVLTDLAGQMTDAGVPVDGRWFACNGTAQGKILASTKAIRQSDLSQELVQKGVIAQIAGFNVYVSGNVTGTINSANVLGIAGHSDFCTKVESFAVLPKVTNADGSGNAVGGVFIQGRYVFTHEVGTPQSLGVLTE